MKTRAVWEWVEVDLGSLCKCIQLTNLIIQTATNFDVETLLLAGKYMKEKIRWRNTA